MAQCSACRAAQFALLAAIEGRSAQAHHDHHHSDVNQVPAVSPCIAPCQQPRGREQVSPRLPAITPPRAEILRESRSSPLRPPRNPPVRRNCLCQSRRPSTALLPTSEANNDRGPERNHGQHKVALDRLERGCAPGQQRTDAGEEKKKQSNRHSHAVIKRGADGDFVAHHVFRQNGEQRSPQDHEAGRQQHKIVEQKT